MKRGLFITGTDTEVGKTVITAGLLRYLRNEGIDAVSMKPVQTGAERVGDGFRAPDLVQHHAAAGLRPAAAEVALMAPYLYEPACSPHLAGRLAGRYPDLAHIEECAAGLLAEHGFLLVEGAGGIMAPLDESTTMLDLMRALGFPVILVAHRGLGTINHSLLSLDALKAANLEVAGIVFNETQDVEEDFIRKDNPDAVQRFGQVEVLGNVDFLGAFDDDGWGRFEACMPGLGGLLEQVRAS